MSIEAIKIERNQDYLLHLASKAKTVVETIIQLIDAVGHKFVWVDDLEQFQNIFYGANKQNEIVDLITSSEIEKIERFTADELIPAITASSLFLPIQQNQNEFPRNQPLIANINEFLEKANNFLKSFGHSNNDQYRIYANLVNLNFVIIHDAKILVKALESFIEQVSNAKYADHEQLSKTIEEAKRVLKRSIFYYHDLLLSIISELNDFLMSTHTTSNPDSKIYARAKLMKFLEALATCLKVDHDDSNFSGVSQYEKKFLRIGYFLLDRQSPKEVKYDLRVKLIRIINSISLIFETKARVRKNLNFYSISRPSEYYCIIKERIGPDYLIMFPHPRDQITVPLSQENLTAFMSSFSETFINLQFNKMSARNKYPLNTWLLFLNAYPSSIKKLGFAPGELSALSAEDLCILVKALPKHISSLCIHINSEDIKRLGLESAAEFIGSWPAHIISAELPYLPLIHRGSTLAPQAAGPQAVPRLLSALPTSIAELTISASLYDFLQNIKASVTRINIIFDDYLVPIDLSTCERLFENLKMYCSNKHITIIDQSSSILGRYGLSKCAELLSIYPNIHFENIKQPKHLNFTVEARLSELAILKIFHQLNLLALQLNNNALNITIFQGKLNQVLKECLPFLAESFPQILRVILDNSNVNKSEVPTHFLPFCDYLSKLDPSVSSSFIDQSLRIIKDINKQRYQESSYMVGHRLFAKNKSESRGAHYLAELAKAYYHLEEAGSYPDSDTLKILKIQLIISARQRGFNSYREYSLDDAMNPVDPAERESLDQFWVCVNQYRNNQDIELYDTNSEGKVAVEQESNLLKVDINSLTASLTKAFSSNTTSYKELVEELKDKLVAYKNLGNFDVEQVSAIERGVNNLDSMDNAEEWLKEHISFLDSCFTKVEKILSFQ